MSARDAPQGAPPHWIDVSPRQQPWSPVVTIIINNHNYAQFVGQAVDSAIRQSYPHVQVVVVDDGSTDGSRDVLAGFGTRIETVLQENAGQASAIYAGMRVARGEVVIVLDSDDVLAPDVTGRVVGEMAADPHCVRVQYRLAVIDEHGVPTGSFVPPVHKGLKTGDIAGYVRRYRMFHPPPTSGNAYLLAAVRMLPPIPSEIWMFLDWWWSDLTSMLGTVRALEGVGGWYRVHPSNLHSRDARDRPFFERHIRLAELTHAAGAQLAAEVGYGGHPATVDTPRDHALATSRLVVHKLGGVRQPAPGWRLAARAAYLTATQPEVPFTSRMRRAVWVPLLGIAPRGSALARSLVTARYRPPG